MSVPDYYYVILAAVVVLGAAALTYKRVSRRAPEENPYIDALKLLVDGRHNEAFAMLQEAVRRGGAPADAYIKLGNLLRSRGEVSKALQIHQSLTVKQNLTKSEKIQLYLGLAEDHARMGNSQRSVGVLERAIRQLNIKDAEVYAMLAKHLHMLGFRDRAYEALKEARRLGGIGERELALYLTSTAEALADKQDYKEARKVLHRALRHDPKCVACLLVLGNIAEGDHELDDAIDHWKQVALLSPPLAGTVLHKLERTLFERGRFSEIEKVYNAVRRARGDDEAASLGLAAFYHKQGRSEEAIQLLEDYLGLHPHSVSARVLLTSLYARHRDPEMLERFVDESAKESWRFSRFECRSCHLSSDVMRWHCPRCGAFDSFSTNSDGA
jgi:lipopolysaccharide biosynthesis regulator YciM